jgi:uncharacterized protein YbjT (DUF2867 family)
MNKIIYKESEILITGGAGVLGKSVCSLFQQRSIPYTTSTHEQVLKNNMVIMNLKTGEGIKEAVSNKKIILHLASDKKHPDNDVSGIQKILNEIKLQGLNPHLIYISIIGIEQLPMTYFKQKLQTEELIKKSGISWSILRATQFHNYVDQILKQLMKLPIGILPKKVLVQPVDVFPVAEKLLEMSFQEPTCRTENIGGKEILSLENLSQSWMAIQNIKKPLLNLPLWGSLGNNLKKGALTCPQKTDEGRNWQQWLNENYKQL